MHGDVQKEHRLFVDTMMGKVELYFYKGSVQDMVHRVGGG